MSSLLWTVAEQRLVQDEKKKARRHSSLPYARPIASAMRPKDKKKKKGGAAAADLDEDAPPAEDGEAGDAAGPKGAVEVTAEDLADEEWGPVKDKKKGKKDKKKKGKAAKDEDEEPARKKPVRTGSTAGPPNGGDGRGRDSSPILIE